MSQPILNRSEGSMRSWRPAALAAIVIAVAAPGAADAKGSGKGLWKLYDRSLSQARYIDLTHEITPDMPVWKGFGPSTFSPAINPATGAAYTYVENGFAATSYLLSTDQFGTQLDPPAHWAPEYPSIDELPPTYAVRPLVVISIVPQVKHDPKYALQVADIRSWEKRHGRIPQGSVVMVRSDWSKRWTEDPVKAKELAADPVFPGVALAALEFLHLKRRILFHGHEPLDTDTTPTIEGEHWLMHHGYTQAEGVDNLDGVPAKGCLVSMGYPRFKGGLGGYARFVAICPPSTAKGTRISRADAPLPTADPLHWDPALGYRVR
jgi:kynurenine formamidase